MAETRESIIERLVDIAASREISVEHAGEGRHVVHGEGADVWFEVADWDDRHFVHLRARTSMADYEGNSWSTASDHADELNSESYGIKWTVRRRGDVEEEDYAEEDYAEEDYAEEDVEEEDYEAYAEYDLLADTLEAGEFLAALSLVRFAADHAWSTALSWGPTLSYGPDPRSATSVTNMLGSFSAGEDVEEEVEAPAAAEARESIIERLVGIAASREMPIEHAGEGRHVMRGERDVSFEVVKWGALHFVHLWARTGEHFPELATSQSRASELNSESYGIKWTVRGRGDVEEEEEWDAEPNLDFAVYAEYDLLADSLEAEEFLAVLSFVKRAADDLWRDILTAPAADVREDVNLLLDQTLVEVPAATDAQADDTLSRHSVGEEEGATDTQAEVQAEVQEQDGRSRRDSPPRQGAGHDGSPTPSSFEGLDGEFLRALQVFWSSETSPESRQAPANLIVKRLESMVETMETEFREPRFEESPTDKNLKKLNTYKVSGMDRDPGAPRSDSQARIRRGPWREDVAFWLLVDTGELVVGFGSWLAPLDKTQRFSRWLRLESMSIRDEVLAAAGRLAADFGMTVELLYTSRTDHYDPRARWRPETERDWRTWLGNEVGQAQICASLAYPCAEENCTHRGLARDILSRIVKSGVRDPWDAAGRLLGVRAQQQLVERRDAGPLTEEVLAEVVAEEDGRVREMWRDGRMADAAWAAVCALMPIWKRFHMSGLQRPVALARPVGWEVPVDDLADVIATTVGELTASRQVPSVVVTSKEKRTIAFREGTAAPRVVVRRAKDDGSVEFAFHLGKLETKGGKRFLPPWRINARLALDGPSGDDLMALAGAVGGAVVFDCGRRECRQGAGCQVSTHEDLVGHWLASTKDPSIRWSFPSAAGQASPFDAALQLVAGLLSLSPYDPPPLVVPSVEGLKWDAFLSHRWGETASFKESLAASLRAGGVSTWDMDDHQRPGSVVRENSLRGLRASRVLIAILSDGYWSSTHCVEELATALADDQPVIPLAEETLGTDADAAVTKALAALDELEDTSEVEPKRVEDWIRSQLNPESPILRVKFRADTPLDGKALGALVAEIREPSTRG